MKKILFLTLSVCWFFNSNAQFVPNGNAGVATTAYTNGSPNDNIYIWCSEGIGTNSASLTVTPTTGTGPWTFKWYYHNETSFSWEPYATVVGTSSTQNNLPSDGYRVQIFDNSNAPAGCYTAWVWNMNSDISAAQNAISCNETNLNGSLSVAGNFTYYNPPPPESIITASTQISVCFSATHSYVSDLAFYLVGPPSIGSPTVLLSPNPGANGQGSTCNENNNVNGLCFSNVSANNFDPCDEDCCGFLCLTTSSCTSNYSGTYGTYGPTNTAINWAPIYGANAAEGGWAVQIYDCIGSDVGSLTNASVTFSNLASNCGGATSINYTSGAINSAINDNSCSPTTASIFQVPISNAFTAPINISASVSYVWTANTAAVIPNATTTLTPLVSNIPAGNNTFTLTATVTYGPVSCTYTDQVVFNSNCCSVTSNAGQDIAFCTGGSAQLGTATSGATYAWFPTTGLSNATIPQPTVTLTNTTSAPITHTYTLTVTDPLDATCTSTDQVTVTVNPLPMIDAGTYTAVCIDAADVALVGSPAGGTFSGTGVSGSTFDPSAGTQQITYAFTDANSCSNSATTTININPLPNVSAGLDQTICSGESVTLSGSGAASYTWTNSVVNGVAFVPSLTPPATFVSYSVTGTDVNGCQNSDQVDVFINPIPTVQVANATICDGESHTITTAASLSGGSYAWTPTNETTASIAVSPSQTTIYTVVYSLNGCDSPPASSTITVNPSPPVNAGVDQAICIGEQVTLTASGATSYAWNGGVTDGVAFSPTSTLTYNVVGTDVNGCQNSDQVVVTVNNLPTIQGGSDVSLCLGQSFTLNGSGGVSYTWDNNVQNGVSFNPSLGTTVYTVIGIDANGCENTDQVVINVVPVPVADFVPSATQGYPVFNPNFMNTSSNGTSYVWDFGNGQNYSSSTPSNTNASYASIGVYSVSLTVSNGICQDQTSTTITVLPMPDAEIFIPNVFTPNGDGANDYFALDVKFGQSIQVQVFNRWGDLMNEITDFTQKWDGKDATEGVYFYKYIVTDLNGKIHQGHGNVTLLR